MQYARRAERRRTSLLTQVHAWHAHTAAQDAIIDPADEMRNMLTRYTDYGLEGFPTRPTRGSTPLARPSRTAVSCPVCAQDNSARPLVIPTIKYL